MKLQRNVSANINKNNNNNDNNIHFKNTEIGADRN